LAEQSNSDCEGDGAEGAEHLIIDDVGGEVELFEVAEPKAVVGHEST
jgi:hypothetical protein